MLFLNRRPKRLPLTLTRTVECPTCGAGPYRRCTSLLTGRSRDKNHVDRVQRAAAAHGKRAVA